MAAWHRRAATLALALWAGLSAVSARADSPYEIEVGVDLPVLGLALAGTSMALLEVPAPACFPACDPSGVNRLDRSVIGNYSESAHTVADIMVFGLLAAGPLLDLVDSGGDGWLTDVTVFAQTILVTQALTQLTKFAVRRSAPFVYDPSTPPAAIESRDAPRAFFSGHAASAFAAASAATTTYWLRNPDDPLRFLVLGASAAVASSAALLKVEAGYHFWTDIVVGALVGTSLGVLVPLLHALD